MDEILTKETVALYRQRKIQHEILCDSHEALREQSDYWQQTAALYADERNELREQLAVAKVTSGAVCEGDWTCSFEPPPNGPHCIVEALLAVQADMREISELLQLSRRDIGR